MFHGLKPTLLPRAAPDATVSNEMALWLLPFDGKYLGQEVYALSVRQDDGLEAGALGSAETRKGVEPGLLPLRQLLGLEARALPFHGIVRRSAITNSSSLRS